MLQTNCYNFCRSSIILFSEEIPETPGTEPSCSEIEVVDKTQDAGDGADKQDLQSAWLVGLAGSDASVVQLWKVVGSVTTHSQEHSEHC